MNELVLLQFIEAVWALFLGASIPLSILYIIHATRKAGQTGWIYALHLSKRILLTALVWFLTIGLFSGAIEFTVRMILDTDDIYFTTRSMIGLTIGANVGLWGGIALLVIGYRKGRRYRKVIQ